MMYHNGDQLHSKKSSGNGQHIFHQVNSNRLSFMHIIFQDNYNKTHLGRKQSFPLYIYRPSTKVYTINRWLEIGAWMMAPS